MLNDKRLVFTVTPGRSGTFYLSELLKGLPDLISVHEPEPGFRQWLPEARHDPALAEKLLAQQKIPYIAAFPEKTYVEASHYFCKGFIDPLLHLGIVPDLILLKRPPRQVASSRFLIGGGMAELKKGQFYKHILGPHEPNFLPVKRWDHWNDYQLCFWYALESFFRMRHYAGLIAQRGGKIFETELESLATGDSYARLLTWLGVPEDVIRTRTRNRQVREEKVNVLSHFKQKLARDEALAQLDLDALEAQVLTECGLPPDYVQKVMQPNAITPQIMPSTTTKKRLVFTVTSGRSGTAYLTHLLRGLPNLRAEHEPVPHFGGLLPEARREPTLARKFLRDEKLPAIAAFPESTYVETSHYFCKGFIEPLAELGVPFDIITLKRDPRQVAASWFLIGGGIKDMREGPGRRNMLSPGEASFLAVPAWDHWNDYQLCYWYALEAHARIRHYVSFVAAHGGKIFETSLAALAEGNDYQRLLEWLDVPEAVIRSRANDPSFRQAKINDMQGKKTVRGREKQLKSLDLDALEAQVQADCGLSRRQVEEVTGAAAPAAGKASRIFVSIASFRDPETQATLDDLFAKAARPERIHVGICLQVDPKQDAACMVKPEGYPGQVRIERFHHKDSLGAGWARAQAFSLWHNEEYVLAIDSHMRFEPGWDEALIGMLERCPPRSLLSTYVPRYTPPDNRDQFPGQILRTRVFGMAEEGNPQMLHVTKQPVPLADTERSALYRTPFVIANFIFCRPEALQEVPFDPHIRFWGDEVTLSARLWTHGYDIYQPDKMLLYHYWRRDELVPIQPYRNLNAPESRRAYARIRHLLGFEPSKDKKALAEMDKYGLGTARKLEDLWAFAGIDWGHRQVSKDALEGRWNTAQSQPRIFVNIASYRDAECQWTVKDLFEKAAHPERVFVGLCWQYDAEADKHCFEVPPPRPEQVRLLPVDWRDAEGVCWARHQVQQLWEGEEYTLMIDSHMRFVPGWDDLMIEELAACASEKPVLSCSPTPYTPPNNLGKNMNPTVRRVKPFMADGNIRCQGEMLDRVPGHPLRGAFIVANFVFSRSDVIREVPYDPYLYFDQEEVMYAARLYTHGWDVFSSRRQFLYHFYNDPKTSVRPLHWKDMNQSSATDNERIKYLYARGLKRFNHLTGYETSADPDVIQELDSYGFGMARTLAQFEEFTGIDFKRKIASEKALRGGYIEDLQKYRDKPFFVPELDKAPVTTSAQVPISPQFRLTPGDFIPMFDTVDENGQQRAMEIYGGRFSFMFFLSAHDVPYIGQLMALLQQFVPQEMQEKLWMIFMVDAPPEQLKILKQQLGGTYGLWTDPGGRIAQAFGASAPAGFLLSRNLKVLQRYDNMPPEALVRNIVADGQKALEDYRFKNRVPHTITELPPALIVPNVLTPEQCEKCIASFRKGYSFKGTVGAEDKLAYRPKAKIRTDHILQPPLLQEIDEKLSRSLFPEIRKVFGFEVTYRELYKVGLYTGEKGGFFQRHRDNFEPPLGYRRVAMTLHLNNNYEGGGLQFPEYDENIYRPPAGSAIVFSCGTLHEARLVTHGERFVLVGFFHGDQDEAYRRQYAAQKGAPLKIKDYTPALLPDPPIRQGRDFYRDWYRENARFGGGQDEK